MVQGLADMREILCCHSETVTLRGQEAHGNIEEISSVIRKAVSSWPLGQLQSALEAELRKGLETTIATVVEQARQQQSPMSIAVAEVHKDSETLLRRHRNRVAVSHCSVTRPMLVGKIHYKSTSYRITANLITALEKDEIIHKEQFEVETSFSFVPSWWMIKFMTARAVKLDILKLSTQGWQTNIRYFNVCPPQILLDEALLILKQVVPESSPIFEFCRKGNLDAVKHLLGSRNASVNDMTEYGWTPLHVSCQCMIHIHLLTYCSSPLVNLRQKSARCFFKGVLIRDYAITLLSNGISFL